MIACIIAPYVIKIFVTQYSCNTHVLRHADSAFHKKNIQENTLSLNDNNENSHKNIYKKSTFQLQWMEIELFKPWLREVPHKKISFFCTFCDKSIIGDLSHIYRYAESKPHINVSKKNKTETKNIDIDMIDDPFCRLMNVEKQRKYNMPL